jgi:AcrR family transcriptional regulator
VGRRPYAQVLRAESAAGTRARILDAVAQRLREAPTEPVSLEKVARIARVSRSTIYGDFESRAGLFRAFVADLWERTGLSRLTEAVATPDARGHLRNGLAEASRMHAQDMDVYRVLFAMHRLDPESVGGAVEAMNEERRGGMAHLARRLHEDGQLREDVTVEVATDVLWMLCSFEALDLLMSDRGRTVEEAVDVLVTVVERSLCR